MAVHDVMCVSDISQCTQHPSVYDVQLIVVIVWRSVVVTDFTIGFEIEFTSIASLPFSTVD